MPPNPPTHPPTQHRLPKEYTAYLVDASPLARTACGVKGVEGVSEQDTWLTVGLRVVRGVLASHVLTSPSDEAAVFLVGGPLPGEEAKPMVALDTALATGGEAGEAGDLVAVQALAPPCARGVVQVGALADAASTVDAPKAPASTPHPEAWARALRTVAKLLDERARKGGRGARRRAARVTIITPDDGASPSTSLPPPGPVRGRAADACSSAAEAGAVVDVLALVGGGGRGV